jgi:hypothetical protein
MGVFAWCLFGISLVLEVVMVPLEGAKGRQEEGSAKDDCEDGIAPQCRKTPRVLNLFLPEVLDNVDAIVGGDLGCQQGTQSMMCQSGCIPA